MSNAPFTDREDFFVLALMDHGTAEEIGRQINRSADAVRRRWRNLGCTATKPVRKIAAPEPPAPAKPIAGTSDAELIAAHLARKGVTRCPPASACGITALELHTGFTAQPAPTLSYREKMAKMIEAGRARRAAA